MRVIKRVGLISIGLFTLSLTVGAVISAKQGSGIQRAYGYTNNDASTYYSSITATEGKELLNQLQSLNTNKRKSLVGYNSMPSKFVYTDPGDNGKVKAFYSGISATYSGNMNREHTWPASRTVGGRGSDDLEDDIHMTRPTRTSDNGNRGNAFYVEGMDARDQSWDPANCGDESYRGDAARIIMYCVVADSRLSLVDKNNDSSSNHTMGKLSDLLKWNLKYPVKAREQTRNEQAENLQGNRNPFIDHPEYACKIWGKYNDAIKKICGTKTINSVTFALESDTKEVGYLFRPQYTVDPEEAFDSLVWSSSEPSVATVGSDGLVTPLAPGTTIIKAESKDDPSVYDSLVLTVTPKQGAPTKKGCGGNIVTTSVVLSTISLFGVGILLVSKFKGVKDEK